MGRAEIDHRFTFGVLRKWRYRIPFAVTAVLALVVTAVWVVEAPSGFVPGVPVVLAMFSVIIFTPSVLFDFFLWLWRATPPGLAGVCAWLVVMAALGGMWLGLQVSPGWLPFGGSLTALIATGILWLVLRDRYRPEPYRERVLG